MAGPFGTFREACEQRRRYRTQGGVKLAVWRGGQRLMLGDALEIAKAEGFDLEAYLL